MPIYVGPYVECLVRLQNGNPVVDSDMIYATVRGRLRRPMVDPLNKGEHLDTHYWVPTSWGTVDDNSILELREETIGEGIANFIFMYRDELHELRLKYGSDFVQVRYGIITG